MKKCLGLVVDNNMDCIVCGASGALVDTDNGVVCSVCDSELFCVEDLVEVKK